MLTSYHVHTFFSDGECNISDHIQRAIELKLDELGISDHFTIPVGDTPVEWSMKLSELPNYCAAIHAAAEQAGDRLIVRCGLEADYDPRTIDKLSKILESAPLDYVIGSIHFVDEFPIDDCKENWDALTESERNDMMRRYWIRIAEMADSGIFNFAGHLDLYKKFGYRPTIDLSPEINSALDAIARAGMAAELNTAGWYKACEESYPSFEIISGCRSRNIPMLVTADAHYSEHLTRGFDRGIQLLHDAGYTQQAVFSGRKMKLAALSPSP